MTPEQDPAEIERRTDEYVRAVRRGRLSVAMFRESMRSKAIRELAAEADARLAEEHGTTTAAIAAVRAAATEAQRQARRRADLDAARRALGIAPAPGAPTGPGRTVDDVRRVGEELRDPETGIGPTEETVSEKLGCSVRWVSTICKDHGGYRSVVPYRK
jgi:hypothetical protein